MFALRRMGCSCSSPVSEETRERCRDLPPKFLAEETDKASSSEPFTVNTDPEEMDDPARYAAITRGLEDEIKAVFTKLDKDGSGSLDKSELKEVVEMYSGEAFDVEQFFEWYDTHGKADSTVDLTEFGWYLADVALSFPDAKAAMPAVIQEFDEQAELRNPSSRHSLPHL